MPQSHANVAEAYGYGWRPARLITTVSVIVESVVVHSQM